MWVKVKFASKFFSYFLLDMAEPSIIDAVGEEVEQSPIYTVPSPRGPLFAPKLKQEP